jgi:general secretion pathway protein M
MKKGSFLSRLAAVLLLALSVTLVALFVVAPIRAEYRRYDALIADALIQRDRFTANLRDSKRLEAELASLKQSQSSEAIYLPEANLSLAGAALIGRLARLINQQDGTLVSSQILGEQESAKVQPVTVHAHMRVSIDALAVILHQLETGYPAIFVDDVRINARTVRRTSRLRRGPAKRSGDSVLDVTYTVTGYLRPAGSQ